MRYVLITRDGPEHRYVANRLAQASELQAIVLDEGRPQSRLKRIKQLWKRYSLPQLMGRTSLALLKRLWGEQAAQREQVDAVLGAPSRAFAKPELIQRVQGINSPEGVECVRALEPDRILVYGTGIIGSKILALSKLAPLNMHTGISPHYRGSACAFWPLHEEELHRLGATVHEVTAKVDGGSIYSVRQAELERDDGLHAVFARCVVVGADQYVEVIERLEREEDFGEPQAADVGREFRAAQRGLSAELRVRRALRQGLVRDWCDAGGARTQ